MDLDIVAAEQSIVELTRASFSAPALSPASALPTIPVISLLSETVEQFHSIPPDVLAAASLSADCVPEMLKQARCFENARRLHLQQQQSGTAAIMEAAAETDAATPCSKLDSAPDGSNNTSCHGTQVC